MAQAKALLNGHSCFPLIIDYFKHMKFRFYTIATVILVAEIFVASSFPTTKQPMFFPCMDKVIHFCVFAVIAASLTGALRENSKVRKRYWIFAAILVAIYGATDEFHQYFVPGRECSILDWFADITGAFVGALIFSKILKKKKLNRSTASLKSNK